MCISLYNRLQVLNILYASFQSLFFIPCTLKHQMTKLTFSTTAYYKHDSPSELVINYPNSLIMINLAHGYTLRFCSSSLARSLISLFCHHQILFHSCGLKSSYIILSPQKRKSINYRQNSFYARIILQSNVY